MKSDKKETGGPAVDMDLVKKYPTRLSRVPVPPSVWRDTRHTTKIYPARTPGAWPGRQRPYQPDTYRHDGGY